MGTASHQLVEVTGLLIYPIKSCRGISLAELEVGARGFLHDREFLVVDETDAFLTQRTAPYLATVQVALADAGVVLHTRDAGELRVPFSRHAEGSDAPRDVRTVTIFNDQVRADDVGNEAAEWFSNVLHRRCRLVQCGADYFREIPLHRISNPATSNPRPQVPFTDAFPILVTSEESLADLNQRCPERIPMDRFRPNLVVTGGGAGDEDRWTTIKVGDVTLHGGPQCERCVITTTDQATGVRTGPEPLRTLGTFRSTRDGKGVAFGRYFVPSGAGRLRLGDTLRIST